MKRARSLLPLALALGLGIGAGISACLAIVCLALPAWMLWVVIVEGPDPQIERCRRDWRRWQEEGEVLRAANGIRTLEVRR